MSINLELSLSTPTKKFPIINFNENEVTFELGKIQVEIRSEKFDYNKNKKHFSSTNYGDYTIEDKYKGQQVWGTDGTIPVNHYKSIHILLDDKTIQIPEKEIENLFNVNIEFAECYYDDKNDILYLSCTNGDGAGGYALLFQIEKGKYKGRKIMMPF